MPFERQSLTDLRAQAAADLAASLPGSNPLLQNSILGILADLLAEGINGAYGYLDYIAKQSVPFTATDEAFEAWAALKDQTRKPATKATGRGVWTGTVGVVLVDGTQVSSGAAAYLTVGDAVVGEDGTVTADLVAVAEGSAGTLVTGSPLALAQAVAGIASTGVATAVTPGVDVEPFTDFRTRVLAIYAAPPQGGDADDYVIWALQVPGVTRAWCSPNGQGAGTVVVYVMFDVAEAVHDGFPQGDNGVATAEDRDAHATGDQLLVADWIYPLQPVTALVYVYAPQRNTVTFTIDLIASTESVKAAISAAIDATFFAYGKPGGMVALSRLEAAIAAISGAAGFVITAVACDHGEISPANGNITSDAGFLPVRGDVTWA